MIKYPEKEGIANTIYAFRCCNEHQEDVEFSECEELAEVILDELNPPINPLELRFKGKRVDNGEWVEGNLIRMENPSAYGENGVFSNTWIMEIEDSLRTDCFAKGSSVFTRNIAIQVHPESVELILPKEKK